MLKIVFLYFINPQGEKGKMRSLIVLTLMSAFFYSCNNSSPTSNNNFTLNAKFTLTDTTGQSKSQFQSGEPFELAFSLTNTTPDTLSYNIVPPMVSFTIYQYGNFITSSFLECPEPQNVAFGVKLPPGKSIKGSWEGPSSPCQSPKIKLAPGNYQVKVSFPYPMNVKVINVSPINFSIVQ